MPDWSQLDGGRLSTIGIDASNSRGTTLTASGSTNVKGSWTQLIASTSQELEGFFLVAQRHGSSNADYLIDLGIGAGGSEQVIVSNLLTTNGSGGVAHGPYALFPFPIPSGSRIAGRCQANIASAQIRISVHGWSPLPLLAASVGRGTTYGAATADSGGTSIDPGGSANTKGSWTEITSSTSAIHTGLLAAFGSQANATRTSCTWLFDIGIGAGGSEQIIIPDVLVQCQATDDTPSPNYTPLLPVQLAAGTRLAVRAACSITDATDRLLDVVLYGMG